LIVVRCGLAGLCTWLELSVFWVYASLVADYLLKAVMLVARFRSGRWKSVIRNDQIIG